MDTKMLSVFMIPRLFPTLAGPHPRSLALRRSKTRFRHPTAAAALGTPLCRAGRGRFRAVPLAATLAIAALLTWACQKVPLLAPSGWTITLTAAATTLPLNGSTDIIAQVLEAGGTPPQDGTLITFTTTLGSIQPPEAETRGGRVTVKFNAGNQNGTATIVASSGGASASGNNAVKIAIGAAAVGRVTVDANPGPVSSSGGTSTIAAFVFDINGNPLGGVPVTLTTDAGTVSPSVVTADANGRAQSTLTTNKTAKVTVTAGNPASGTGGTTTTTTAQTATVTVNVNAPATVTIGTTTRASPTAGQPVTLPLTYNTTNTTPTVRLTVDWGDGSAPQTFNGQPSAISHQFRAPGFFVVVVTATDSFGDSSTATASITVGQQPRPTVDITASPASPKPGEPVTFTITATPPTGQTITSVTVDFGDGTPALTFQGNVKTVQHIYASAGTFTATAVATDSAGGTGSGATVIVVGGTGPVADFTMSPEPSKVNQTVTFNASDSTSGAAILSYDWDFGDGTPVVTTNTAQTTHPYGTAATFTARVTIHDAANRTATKSKPHTVNP